MSDIKPIVALHPAIPRKEARIIAKQLAAAGYLPVLADPAHVRVIDVLPVGQTDKLAEVAFRILRKQGWNARSEFADAVLDMLAEVNERRAAGERGDGAST